MELLEIGLIILRIGRHYDKKALDIAPSKGRLAEA
jgi:hypothetical protein